MKNNNSGRGGVAPTKKSRKKSYANKQIKKLKDKLKKKVQISKTFRHITWVNCVVFPLPVSPTMTTTELSLTILRSSVRAAKMGRYSRCSRIVFCLANSLEASDFSFMCSENCCPFLYSSSSEPPCACL